VRWLIVDGSWFIVAAMVAVRIGGYRFLFNKKSSPLVLQAGCLVVMHVLYLSCWHEAFAL